MADTDNAAPLCRVVHGAAEVMGKQGRFHAPGISAQSAGSQGIHLQIVRIPPGGKAKAHKHENHETAIYVPSGECGTWYGERLEHRAIAKAGDFLYIPANVPHLPYNLSDTESCVAELRQAFAAMIEDAAFLADIEKMKLEFDPLSGEELQKIVAGASQLSPALIERARSMAVIEA